MKDTINSSTVSIKPTEKLIKCIKSLHDCSDMPSVFVDLRKRKPEIAKLHHTDPLDCNLLTSSDRDFLNSLDLNPATLNTPTKESEEVEAVGNLLSVKDLLWLSNKLQEQRSSSKEKVYLHELLMGSEVVLPQNDEIPRNVILEKRCQLLKRQQENRAYKAMTKDVDTVRKQLPEDTIAYQIKHLNRQLIAVGQFIISVFAGFMFGFQGIELMIGPFDFGFRLLLGVIFSLTIALAELYFLAKKLNEDLNYKNFIEEKQFHPKMD